MDSKQLKALLDQLEALKPTNLAEGFSAGIDAAKEMLGGVIQKALDNERIQKLEAELSELRAKYGMGEAPKPKKRRGRKPKSAKAKSE
jgi:hypothetical protein